MSFYIEIDSNETFETATKTSGVCVVDFYTSWCNPCKKMAPLLEKAVKEHPILSTLHTDNLTNPEKKVSFVKVNIENHQELAEKFKVSSIPLICFYKNGVLCKEQVVGANLDNIMVNIIKLTSDFVEESNKNNKSTNEI
jgi:thiol-disulfide isomerase/thioredoxin